MSTQLILLERVDNLGEMGDVVSVKPGYARNFLLPNKKALRASKENIAYFEGKKKHLQAESEKQKKEAEKLAKTLDGLKVALIRAASESGQLYGSVNSRDIAQAAAEQSKQAVTRQMVSVNQNFKTIGLFPVELVLHPEVKVEVTVNIARSVEESQIQAETGRALVADAAAEAAEAAEAAVDADAALAEALEEEALEAEKQKRAEEAEAAAAKEEADKAKSEARAAKKAAKAEEEAEDAEAADAGADAETADEAPAEDASEDETAE